MSTPAFVRVQLENGAKASIPTAHAESLGLKPLDEPAVGPSGGALLPEYPEKDVKLRGKELDAALTAAGLSTTGKLAEKQQRLAEHHAAAATAGTPSTGGEPAPTPEV